MTSVNNLLAIILMRFASVISNRAKTDCFLIWQMLCSLSWTPLGWDWPCPLRNYYRNNESNLYANPPIRSAVAMLASVMIVAIFQP